MTIVFYTFNVLNLPSKVLKQKKKTRKNRYEPDCRENTITFLIRESSWSMVWELFFLF